MRYVLKASSNCRGAIAMKKREKKKKDSGKFLGVWAVFHQRAQTCWDPKIYIDAIATKIQGWKIKTQQISSDFNIRGVETSFLWH